ncbi:HIT domain-containing protein [Pseudoruegeria sp. SK021]|uniref:HIT domain-containing protein n=1 Tax=Pseudoruegeria sp. SK021 TaxID=1933035 RepID=UPI000A257389|nr:HIT domain-containing protein [Pseudoruegeria sp. SK021]OSP56578.1 histidine triad nucleotide-binding protein [Pseudoruegeria sp. SK021]
MAHAYDDQNIFAKILRGEIPCTKVKESAHSLAFRDVRPQAPEHILVIPKGAYVNYDDFALAASEAEIVDFTRLLGEIAAELGVRPADGGAGFRLVSNAGRDSLQEVPHMHVHLLAGRPLGGLLPAD